MRLVRLNVSINAGAGMRKSCEGAPEGMNSGRLLLVLSTWLSRDEGGRQRWW